MNATLHRYLMKLAERGGSQAEAERIMAEVACDRDIAALFLAECGGCLLHLWYTEKFNAVTFHSRVQRSEAQLFTGDRVSAEGTEEQAETSKVTTLPLPVPRSMQFWAAEIAIGNSGAWKPIGDLLRDDFATILNFRSRMSKTLADQVKRGERILAKWPKGKKLKNVPLTRADRELLSEMSGAREEQEINAA